MAYRFCRQRPTKRHLRHIVFVCKGNICRSAFAEHYLRALLIDRGFKIESCGIDTDEGTFSPAEAMEVAKHFGLDLSEHRSKALYSCDLQSADLILAMEYGQLRLLSTIFPDYKNKFQLLRDFALWPERLLCNISDPYGFEKAEFLRCFRQLKRALDGLKGHLERNKNM